MDDRSEDMIEFFHMLEEDAERALNHEYSEEHVVDTLIEEDPELAWEVVQRYESLLNTANGFYDGMMAYDNTADAWLPYGAELAEGLPDGMVRFESGYPVFADADGTTPVHDIVDDVGRAVHPRLTHTPEAMYERFSDALGETMVTYWDNAFSGWDAAMWELINDDDVLVSDVFKKKGGQRYRIDKFADRVVAKASGARARERSESYAEEYGGVSFPWRE